MKVGGERGVSEVERGGGVRGGNIIGRVKITEFFIDMCEITKEFLNVYLKYS